MLLNGSIYKLMINGCSSTNSSRYFGVRLTNVRPGSEKLWGLYTCYNIFSLGQTGGHHFTTAHYAYLKHPAGWKTARNLVS